MVALAVAIRILQQTRSARASRTLRKLVTSTVTVRRRADADQQPLEREVALGDVVPGDVVVLRAGDVVPAGLRIVSSADLVVDHSALTGETPPVSKTAVVAWSTSAGGTDEPVLAAPSLCFSGTAVVAGTATAVVIATGVHTYSGSLARGARDLPSESSFDRGVRTPNVTSRR
jgi:Mg2+-importing ATPase